MPPVNSISSLIVLLVLQIQIAFVVQDPVQHRWVHLVSVLLVAKDHKALVIRERQECRKLSLLPRNSLEAAYEKQKFQSQYISFYSFHVFPLWKLCVCSRGIG